MIKKYLPLIIAAALGLVATFLVNVYIQQQTDEARRGAVENQKSLSTVVVAIQDIGAGVSITEDMVKEETVNIGLLQPRAATAMDRVVGKISMAPISKGEQILLNKLTVSGQELNLSSKIPPGKRAITIPVDNISSVGGMIRPGDHVDIVGSIPIAVPGPDGKPVQQSTNMSLFQNVLVLAVGQDFTTIPGAKKEERAVSPIITFALSPQEANLITFIQEQGGRIRLILRSPQDTQVQPAAPASWDMVLKTVMPQAFQEQPQRPETAKPPQKQVEIIRGLQRELRNLD